MAGDDERSSEEAKKILERLTELERKVLEDRFGLDLSENPDLRESAKQFESTRERIRDIVEEALKKLD